MILSFHPCFEADKNIICAGRNPGTDELNAIKAADAVILPQGCTKSLYEMARKHCPHVFPNYDARFKYPGKIGQIRLFREINVLHPKTEIYFCVDKFYKTTSHFSLPTSYFPVVFKFDWGGQGDNVYLIQSFQELRDVLEKAANYEKTGQKGFLIQEYIPNQNKTLRIVVISTKTISYWRVQKNTENFCTNLSKGGIIETKGNQDLQNAAVASVKAFCKQTGINLAGFDFLFAPDLIKNRDVKPLFLEINYFFGRRGLGGSEKFYEILLTEIRKWVSGVKNCRRMM